MQRSYVQAIIAPDMITCWPAPRQLVVVRFRSLSWTLNTVFCRYFYTKPFCVPLSWLHIQVHWPVCCISDYN